MANVEYSESCLDVEETAQRSMTYRYKYQEDTGVKICHNEWASNTPKNGGKSNISSTAALSNTEFQFAGTWEIEEKTYTAD
jgi:hypothetical protein